MDKLGEDVLPKKLFQLGIRDIITFNEVFITKWRCSMFHQRGSLWCEVLESKYGGWRNLIGEDIISNSSIWWRDFRKICGGDALHFRSLLGFVLDGIFYFVCLRT